ncbi:hypothetical protein PUN28_007992 [Cardiocondyla obscurior]|uniref:Uncharacterized protein n=1 Tax=Cardiocondyla obscurior TaxID=286306 RepID=A0AAW2FY30_9HYME
MLWRTEESGNGGSAEADRKNAATLKEGPPAASPRSPRCSDNNAGDKNRSFSLMDLLSRATPASLQSSIGDPSDLPLLRALSRAYVRLQAVFRRRSISAATGTKRRSILRASDDSWIIKSCVTSNTAYRRQNQDYYYNSILRSRKLNF